MREYSEHGTDAVRFLLDVMEDANPDEPYTWGHRMSAAHELLRRGWDTNYDSITPEMLQDYWRDQQSTRLSVAQKKRLAGLPVSLDDYDQYDNEDYQAIAQSIREHEDLEAEDYEAVSPVEKSPLSPRERARVRGNTSASSPSQNNAATYTRHSRENGNPAGQGEGQSSPSCTSMSIPDDKPDCYHEPLDPRAAGNLRLPVQNRVRRIRRRRNHNQAAHPRRLEGTRSRARGSEGNRRSRRRPPTAQPPRRHPKNAHYPQPLVTRVRGNPVGRGSARSQPTQVCPKSTLCVLCAFCGYSVPEFAGRVKMFREYGKAIPAGLKT